MPTSKHIRSGWLNTGARTIKLLKAQIFVPHISQQFLIYHEKLQTMMGKINNYDFIGMKILFCKQYQQDNNKTTDGTEENICKSYIWQGKSIQSIQITPKIQW